MDYYFKTMASPVGELKLVASNAGLAAVLWENDNPRRVRLNATIEDKTHTILLETEQQLNEYFDGKRTTFSVKLDFVGDRVSEESVASLVNDTLWRDAELWRYFQTNWR